MLAVTFSNCISQNDNPSVEVTPIIIIFEFNITKIKYYFKMNNKMHCIIKTVVFFTIVANSESLPFVVFRFEGIKPLTM